MNTFEKNAITIANYLEDKMSFEEEVSFMKELENNGELRQQYEDELLVSALLQNEERKDTGSNDLLFQPADDHIKMIEVALEKKIPQKKTGLLINIFKDYRTIAAASLLIILLSVFFLFRKKKSDQFVTSDKNAIINDSIKKSDSIIHLTQSKAEEITKAPAPKDSTTKNNSTAKIPNIKANPISHDTDYNREIVEKNSLKDSISKTNSITKIQMPSPPLPINENDILKNDSSKKNHINNPSNNIASKNIFKEFYTAYSSKNVPVEINEYYQSLIKGNYSKVLSATAADYQLMGSDTRSKLLDQYMQFYKGLSYLAENRPDDAIQKFNIVLQSSPKNAPQYYEAQWYYMLALLKNGDVTKADSVASLIASSVSPYKVKAVQVLKEIKKLHKKV